MWLFVVEVRQCSCTSIKLHQVHSLTRNIPISNQSLGMGYRYIWPWGSQDVFTRTGGRDFCPLSSTEHEGWTPIWCWLLLIWHIIIVKVPQCDSSPKLLHSTPRPSLSKAAVIQMLIGGEWSLWLSIFDSRHKRLHVNFTFLFYNQVLVYRSTRISYPSRSQPGLYFDVHKIIFIW